MSRADLQPTSANSARFLLERTADAGARASYRAEIVTAEATYAGTAELGDDGTVALAMIAKLPARSAAKKREDGLPPWPARVLRWRGPGRGA